MSRGLLQECEAVDFPTGHFGWRQCPEKQNFRMKEIVKVRATFGRSCQVPVWLLEVTPQLSVYCSSNKVYLCFGGVNIMNSRRFFS